TRAPCAGPVSGMSRLRRSMAAPSPWSPRMTSSRSMCQNGAWPSWGSKVSRARPIRSQRYSRNAAAPGSRSRRAMPAGFSPCIRASPAALRKEDPSSRKNAAVFLVKVVGMTNTMQQTVVIADYDYGDVDIERAIIEDAGLRLVAAQCKTEDDVIEAASDADAIIAQYATS